ncbi:MAG: hypothetical protein H5T85_02585 [Actinobacteria bacterium]|nr:hypothetical protein [Actinomycetota bacterium]
MQEESENVKRKAEIRIVNTRIKVKKHTDTFPVIDFLTIGLLVRRFLTRGFLLVAFVILEFAISDFLIPARK